MVGKCNTWYSDPCIFTRDLGLGQGFGLWGICAGMQIDLGNALPKHVNIAHFSLIVRALFTFQLESGNTLQFLGSH